MSDDLPRKLRKGLVVDRLAARAADRIEQLTRERDEARADNQRLRVALHQIVDLNLDDLQGPDAPDHLFDVVEHIATQALEEPL